LVKLFKKSHDGGPDSGVTGYWLIEAKSLFSVVLLRFEKGTRDAYHSHAFNALTLWLKGKVREHNFDGTDLEWKAGQLKYTPRDKMHMVEALETTWALSVRGPWADRWLETSATTGKRRMLTHGRVEVEECK
jgi:quercetin dioxygenase-like cupin family protein